MDVMDLDTELLITLVESRPLLWDTSCPRYKDKTETRRAWREICSIIRNDFEDLSDEDKIIFVKHVIKRWGNIRDSFKKSRRKIAESLKSGAGVSSVKKYVFDDQLQFLNKVFHDRHLFESLKQDQPIDEEEVESEIEGKMTEWQNSKTPPPPSQTIPRKKPKLDCIEMKILDKLEEQSDRHLSFFKGIIPTLNKFDDDDIVEFQLGVMELVSKIKNQKRMQNQSMQYQCNLLNPKWHADLTETE